MEKNEIDRGKLGKKNRNKGHNAERKRAKTFQDLGYTFCKTSRAASRVLDNCKVDLANIPYNVQIKSVVSGINYQNIFEDIGVLLKENFPPTDPLHTFPSIIIHDRGRKDSQKQVIMKEKDFFELLKYIKECQDKENNPF